MNFNDIVIDSPKRIRKRLTGWDAFFPYYAGYPASFASKLLKSTRLPRDSKVYDPWNGSGTTTFAAIEHNFHGVGLDLNPAMVIIARARSILPTEADSLIPLAREIAKQAEGVFVCLDTEPLCQWFDDATASAIRAVEMSLRHLLVGDLVTDHVNGRLDRISSVASTLYVALFASCRKAAVAFRSSNPTWFKSARKDADRVSLGAKTFSDGFEAIVSEMAMSLTFLPIERERASIEIRLGDSTNKHVEDETIDFVLTSPPYCTRIDYTSATKVELAVISPLLGLSFVELGRQMIGSTRVPTHNIEVRDNWGSACLSLISDITSHPSRASSGYYRRTHIDYFDKLDRSLERISRAMKSGSGAVMIVQDSYYKEIHNDLPLILTEIASSHSLTAKRREDFDLAVTLAASHPHSAKYLRPKGATESVLCFLKN